MCEYYSGNGLILYASKAFSSKYIYKLAKEEGIGIDVVSGGELYIGNKGKTSKPNKPAKKTSYNKKKR